MPTGQIGLTVCSVTEAGDGQTFITGEVADQAALRGILEKIWNLNLVLVSVKTPLTTNHTIAIRK